MGRRFLATLGLRAHRRTNPHNICTNMHQHLHQHALLPHPQTVSRRPIPILPITTAPGDAIASSRLPPSFSPATITDPELERLALQHLSAAAKEAQPILISSATSIMPYPAPPVAADTDLIKAGNVPGGNSTAVVPATDNFAPASARGSKREAFKKHLLTTLGLPSEMPSIESI